MNEGLFKSKPIKIDTLGAYLKGIREKLNLDIKTVSLLTQIKPVYLENLENGEYQKLPADVYIRGFLKNLSQLYRVDEQILVDQFEKEYGFGVAHKRRAAMHQPRAWFTPRTIIIAASILVFVAALAYVVSQISSVLTPPKLEISSPNGDENVTGNSIVVSGAAEVGSDVSINNQSGSFRHS